MNSSKQALGAPFRALAWAALVLALGLAAVPEARAQEGFFTEEEEQPKPERRVVLNNKMVIGGSFGLQFGTITQVDLSPHAGYRITDKWLVALGGTYNFFAYTPARYSNYQYGYRLFTEHTIFRNIFAHAEYEMLNHQPFMIDWAGNIYEGDRLWVSGALGGVGYRQMFGERFSSDLLLLYNFTLSQSTPYTNPVFRIAFNFWPRGRAEAPVEP